MENKGTNNMRKLLQTIGAAAALLTLSMGANAAEEPPYPRPVEPPVYVPPPFSWTGFYIGANLGGRFGRSLCRRLFRNPIAVLPAAARAPRAAMRPPRRRAG